MKKLLLSICILSSFSIPLFAQDENQDVPSSNRNGIDVNRLRFGAFVAPNISWMKATSTKSDDGNYAVKSNGSKVGFTWGLLADYFFTRNYGIATGFQLNSTGGKILATRIPTSPSVNTVQSADFTYFIQYLEVPFNLKLRTEEIEGAGIKIFGQVGITGGINIGKKATYTVVYRDALNVAITKEGTKEKISGTLSIAPVMLQLNVGGGVEKPISNRIAAYAGIFFNNGFLPDATNPKNYSLSYPGEFSDGKIRLNNFAFRLGIFF